MKDQTNEESLDPMPGKLPVTASRSGTASAQHGGSRSKAETAEGNHRAAPVDPDAWFEQVLDRANQSGSDCTTGTSPNRKERAS